MHIERHTRKDASQLVKKGLGDCEATARPYRIAHANRASGVEYDLRAFDTTILRRG